MSLLAPLYQSEIAHPSIRGRLTTLQQFCLGIGALVASIIAYELEKKHKGTVFQWRFPLGFQIVPAVPLACLIFLFPEVSRLDEATVPLTDITLSVPSLAHDQRTKRRSATGPRPTARSRRHLRHFCSS